MEVAGEVDHVLITELIHQVIVGSQQVPIEFLGALSPLLQLSRLLIWLLHELRLNGQDLLDALVVSTVQWRRLLL